MHVEQFKFVFNLFASLKHFASIYKANILFNIDIYLSCVQNNLMYTVEILRYQYEAHIYPLMWYIS